MSRADWVGLPSLLGGGPWPPEHRRPTPAGDGKYFDAATASELGTARASAVAAPFRVFADDDDEPIASGTVGG